MNLDIMNLILDKIKSYEHIMLFRHVRIDGDCVGATKGLKELILRTWPEKKVYIIDDEHSDFLAFLGPDDEEVSDEIYKKSLGIALDTATCDRISNQKYRLCKELIKIDHHIPVDSYGHYNWEESKRTSTCELLVKFYDTFRDTLVMTPLAAYYLYTGMVTDSGRFRYAGVSGDTLRYAAILLDQGIDTDTLYANLYLEEYSQLKFKAAVYDKMQLTKHGVSYIVVDMDMQKEFGLTRESAGTSVECMESIKNTLCWIAFILTEDGSIRARIRSRFVPINKLAEKYHGGGHANASGATVYSLEEMNQLIHDADALVRDYKASHEGWL